ncbi:MarR family transcriptional regulator [Candidatus Marinamargulisbacteria bacterium SCGC AG-410-N11]|nr:MarR family transcriptional regulator [Candidatus Marinamargulisbacteria bacterium SCGC AG-410-N11]
MHFKHSPKDSPGLLLWQLCTIWSRKINQLLKQFNITHVQFVILANIKWLTLSKQLVTQVLIANLSKIDPVVISNVLKTLESKQLVKRKTSKDTRFKEVKLTKEGLDLLALAISEVETFDTDFFKDCPDLISFNKGITSLLQSN